MITREQGTRRELDILRQPHLTAKEIRSRLCCDSRYCLCRGLWISVLGAAWCRAGQVTVTEREELLRARVLATARPGQQRWIAVTAREQRLGTLLPASSWAPAGLRDQEPILVSEELTM